VSEELANHRANGVSFAPRSLESPSLFRPETNGVPAPAAYETKFLLSEELAQAIEARLRGRLALDSHADPNLDGAYRTTSLYTDTPQFDVFRRIGEYGKSKFRVRRYGSNGAAYLERKDKKGDRVHKSRVSVPSTELAGHLSNGAIKSWPGGWFRDEIARRRLAPVCGITYDRMAYLGSAENGAVRVTFDRRVRGVWATTWDVVPVQSAVELLPNQVICEFKYRLAMPRLFKEIVEAFGLQPTACSKYRRFLTSTGMIGPRDVPITGDGADA
jgi:VTC domain